MGVRNSTYNFQNVSDRVGAEAELLRLQEQALMGWNKEFRTLQGFGLSDGMNILEAGAGPGFVTGQLLRHLPNSKITALDIDDNLLETARRRLGDVPETRLQLTQASVYETGLPGNTYDFVIARLLFLHLHQPLQAAMELKRVLKPGGKLAIIDIDDGVFGALSPDLDVLPSILNKLARQQAARGGNRHIGRSLPRLLADSGFQDTDMDAVIQHSDLHGIEGFNCQLDIGRFKAFCQQGIITEEEYDALNTAYEHFTASPDAHAMMLFFMACGSKPAD
ncbi:methyltransferase domain-containing protein [Paenibacillus tengchongensis]|uniref:methyltransferase domain-containing protein n=1 Tax=Paenibacillus tengchongensis TaxID=2608684 RepID=UPI00124F4AB4|nr:methyltransferase domain-containing protein [Paenibacillus tengchongensis]